jgi:hypothetical protein
MRKLLVIAVIAILLSISIVGGLVLTHPLYVGWTEADLASPSASVLEAPSNSIPGPLTDVYRPSQWSLEWLLSEVYATYGGVAWVSLNNTGHSPLFVYGLSIRWTDTNISSSRSTDALVPPGEVVEIGLLSFPAPSPAGHYEYTLQLDLAVGHPNGDWYDYGSTAVGSHQAWVLAPSSSTSFKVYHNYPQYYDRVNALVDLSITAPIAQEIKARFPGEYSVLQIVEGYEWVRRNIEYVADEEDYWQSANETLSLGTGDCEDQAILLASLIGELGGNARVNIIEGHAFPTVFVGKNASVISSVRDSIASYYWVNATDLHFTYLSDDSGIWMVIDPVGMPFAGGMPSLSAPQPSSSWADDWTFESSTWCHIIDATGKTGGNWLPFL